MDPLSLSASIAGLISLAQPTFNAVYKYARAVKDARSDVQVLAEEINGLMSILLTLQALTLDLESEGAAYDPTLRTHHLHIFTKTLSKIKQRVEKSGRPKLDNLDKLDGIVARLKWPFSASETKDLLKEISRQKDTITMALTADSLRKLQLSLSQNAGLGKELSAVADAVRRVEINTQITVDDKRQEVLSYFMEFSPQQNLEMSIKLRHPTTGMWLTESVSFINWLENPGSKIWLTGIPGMGKTVLAGTVIQEALTRSCTADNVGVGFFFCDYKNKTTWEPVNVLGAIASQLARQKTEAFDILQAYYNQLHPAKGLQQTPDPDDLRAKIGEMSELFTQTIIVVDGLDECDDSTDTVVEVLQELATNHSLVSMALFSRNHDNIRFRLELDFQHIQMAAHKDDIELYVAAELEKRIKEHRLQLSNPAMKDEISERLVERADGMFRWVVCQIDYLCECVHDQERREALTKLPPDLPESYRRLLVRINQCSTAVQTMVHKSLLFIAYADPKLSIQELRQAISAPDTVGAYLDESNTVPELEISRRCSSLIRKSQDGLYFEFAHFSVQEFLEDITALLGSKTRPDLQRYFLDRRNGDRILATQCLSFLQLGNFDKLPSSQEEGMSLASERHRDFPFYYEAALRWPALIIDGVGVNNQEDAKLWALMTSLFQPRKSGTFNIWALELTKAYFEVHGNYQKYSRDKVYDDDWADRKSWEFVSDDMFMPLHVAAGLSIPELCSYLLEKGTVLSYAHSSISGPFDLAILTFAGLPRLDTKLWKMLKKNDYELYNYPEISGKPSAARWNSTIALFANKAAKMSNWELLPDEMSLFSLCCGIAAHSFSDLSAILTILSAGITPSVSDLDTLNTILQITFDHGTELAFYLACQSFEESSLALLVYLKGTFSSQADWGFRMSSIIWLWAVQVGFEYTSNPLLLDSRITMSPEVLATHAFRAVKSEQQDNLARCLADERLDLAHRYEAEDRKTLLHIALDSYHISPVIIEMLLDAGSDPSLQDWEGRRCLHCIQSSSDQALPVLKILHARGVDLFSADTSGNTIWHYWVREGDTLPEVLEELYILYGETSKAALLCNNDQGDTPLLLALKQRLRTSTIAQARTLIDFSSKFKGFWEVHPPVLGAAAQFGSEEVVRHFLDAGVQIETAEAGLRTPLHQLGLGAELGCLELLLSLYPKAVDWKFGGCLPIELYFKRVLSLADKNDLHPSLTVDPKVDPHTMDTLIRCTQCRSHVIQSSTTIKLFKNFIKQGQSHTAEILLKYGLDVHQRDDGASSVEYACEMFVGEWLFSTTKPRFSSKRMERELLSAVLRHARERELNDVGIAGPKKGLGLLHSLAVLGRFADLCWLIRHLVCYGVNVNALGTSSGMLMSALVHHCSAGCFRTAEVLLDLGADPTIIAQTTWGPAQYAIRNHHSPFLKRLLKHVTDHNLTMPWERTYLVNTRSAGHSEGLQWFEGFNDLHFAAIAWSVQCLNFFLNERLITDVNATSAEGFTPLHFAAFNNTGPRHSDTNCLKVMEILLSNGAVVNTTSDDGTTPLHIAARDGNLPGVEFLLDHSAVESLNVYGKSPRSYAEEEGHELIVRCFDTARSSGAGEPSALEQSFSPKKRVRYLAEALENAIATNNLEECKRLVAEGCPIDVRMPKKGWFSPLAAALQSNHTAIAMWLLENDATTISLMASDRRDMSIIDFAAWKSPLIVLPLLLKTYVSQGGDLVQGDDYPFHKAVNHRGERGERVESLLRSIREHTHAIAQQGGNISIAQVVPVIINRREPAQTMYFARKGPEKKWWPYTAAATALHYAVLIGSETTVSLLAENGAEIDARDSYGLTPLAFANTRRIAECLLRLGASPTALLRLGTITSFISWWGSVSDGMLGLFFGSGSGMPEWRLDGLIDLTLSGDRYITSYGSFEVSPDRIRFLDKAGVDFTREDSCGRSIMHCIMCSESSIEMAFRGFNLETATPFPWHLEWISLVDMSFLTSKFAFLQRRLPYQTFRKILNLEPRRGWSPLCRAAALDLVNVIENCLSMTASIDFEGAPLGSALIVACACGSLESVKCLMRHGAAISYAGSAGTVCAFTKTRSASIRAWLLVGRFTERASIAEMEFWSPKAGNQVELRPWSGTVQTQVALIGRLERFHGESSIMYVKRLGDWKRAKLGMVVRGP